MLKTTDIRLYSQISLPCGRGAFKLPPAMLRKEKEKSKVRGGQGDGIVRQGQYAFPFCALIGHRRESIDRKSFS